MSIYTFIKEQEIQYSQPLEVTENWSWNMKDHVRHAILMKHGKFIEATNDLKLKGPYKNIILPILNLRYRAEDIDLKNVDIFVEDSDAFHLSFLIKKYHDEVYSYEHKLDTFFDEANQEKIDYGGVIARKGKTELVYEPLESIAFCDQTDLLSGAIGFKLFFSPEELYAMEKNGWGSTTNGATVTIDDLITLADFSKQQDAQTGIKTKTPGKYIEIYRVHGTFPTSYLKDNPSEKEGKYTRQLHIVAFYKDKDGKDQGVTLYRKPEYESPFKTMLSGKKIRNRALSLGGVEELVDPQIWTNYNEIVKKNFLDAASKVILQTTDPAYASRNKIQDMENMEITVTQENTRIEQVNTTPANFGLFDRAASEWEAHGQTTGGATDALLGKNPGHGTPFRLENLIIQQGQGLHSYRQGQFATWLEEIYQDWIIPDIRKELANGTKFLATLSEDEMEYVTQCLVKTEEAKLVKEKILNGEAIYKDEIDAFKQSVEQSFRSGGSKRMIEILKGELEDKSIRVRVNISGKDKDLAGMVDKLSNIIKEAFATYNPQTGKFAIFDDPRMSKIFSKILEYSGLTQSDFSLQTYTQPVPMQLPANPQQVQ